MFAKIFLFVKFFQVIESLKSVPINPYKWLKYIKDFYLFKLSIVKK